MSYLPKATILVSLSSILFLPNITSAFTHTRTPSTPNFGYHLEAVATKLSHPSIFTFDSLGRVIVYEGGVDPKIVRVDPDGLQVRLTSVGALQNWGQINAISEEEGRVYIFQTDMMAIVKPNGDLDVVKNAVTPAPVANVSVATQELTKNLGLTAAATVVGPDGTTYLSELGQGSGDGLIWKVLKSDTAILGSINPTEFIILFLSILMLTGAAIIFWRRLGRIIKIESTVRSVWQSYKLWHREI